MGLSSEFRVVQSINKLVSCKCNIDWLSQWDDYVCP